jgi:hypothetical protein
MPGERLSTEWCDSTGALHRQPDGDGGQRFPSFLVIKDVGDCRVHHLANQAAPAAGATIDAATVAATGFRDGNVNICTATSLSLSRSRCMRVGVIT